MKLGFIGLGIMGRPMAKHLVQAGHDVMVADLNQDLVNELVSMGAKAGTYAEMGKECDIVMMILPTESAMTVSRKGASDSSTLLYPEESLELSQEHSQSW